MGLIISIFIAKLMLGNSAFNKKKLDVCWYTSVVIIIWENVYEAFIAEFFDSFIAEVFCRLNNYLSPLQTPIQTLIVSLIMFVHVYVYVIRVYVFYFYAYIIVFA